MPAADLVAVDVGQTGTRARVERETTAEEFRGPGYRPAATPEESAAAAVRACLPDALRTRTLVVGATGLRGGRPNAAGMAAALRSSVSADRVVVADDAVSAYAGMIGADAGVVVIAGTGAVALAIDGRGGVAQVDGYGALVGDLGGGFWIGREGFRWALRAEENREGGSAELSRRIRADLQVSRLRDAAARWRDETTGIRALAALAPTVCGLAVEGEVRAAGVVSEAGRLLAESAATALTNVGVTRSSVVGITGGLTGSPALVDAFSAAWRGAYGATGPIRVGAQNAALTGVRRLADPTVLPMFPGLVDTELVRAP